MTKRITLSRGLTALVDAEDFQWLDALSWHASVNRARNIYARHTYAETIDGRRLTRGVMMHRVILDAPADKFVDHIDGDGLNNTRANLRLCSTAENQMNKRFTKSPFGLKGIYSRSRGYGAQIKKDGKRIHLGTFDTPEEAARAYDAAALVLFGDFAQINFPIRGVGPAAPLSEGLLYFQHSRRPFAEASTT